ncbi:MAG: alpha/beta fold hydrolase [Hyphomicrobiales bacterium]|nr:alpha/beta fold hydrolase [Hyphomicrobiales bacterium]
MRSLVAWLALAFGWLAATSALAGADVVAENRMVKSSTPGIELFVRNKHLADMPQPSPDRTLLFIHGATYPAETSFDLPIEGESMMDLFARAGFDVFLVDVRGYGRSTRPPEMDQAPEASAPVATSEQAGSDLGSAVDAILTLRGIPKLDLMGWSWGTSIAGAYAARHSDKIERLVLYAPAWVFEPPTEPPKQALPAYRLVDKESARQRWYRGVAADKQATLVPAGVFDEWWRETLATDPVGSKMDPPKLRAPNGVFVEFTQTWRAGKPYYDPGDITVPTLLIHAEWDADLPSYMTRNYFARLTHTPYKRMVELGEGTHTVMLEKNRMQFFHEILGFLTETDPTSLK